MSTRSGHASITPTGTTTSRPARLRFKQLTRALCSMRRPRHEPTRTDAKEARGMTTFRALFAALMVVASFGLAVAKLPPPPPMDDAAKAAAEEKKATDAAAAEAGKQLQARTEDRVAARYIAEQKAKGIVVTPQMGATAS